jgi:hypothetical protein
MVGMTPFRKPWDIAEMLRRVAAGRMTVPDAMHWFSAREISEQMFDLEYLAHVARTQGASHEDIEPAIRWVLADPWSGPCLLLRRAPLDVWLARAPYHGERDTAFALLLGILASVERRAAHAGHRPRHEVRIVQKAGARALDGNGAPRPRSVRAAGRRQRG